jgi:hypothetical protein
MKVSIQAIPLRGRPADILDDAGRPRLFDTISEAKQWLSLHDKTVGVSGSGVRGWQFRFELEPMEKSN